MPKDWEQQFREWAQPPGKTEQERCDNAASAIRNAIGASAKLRDRKVTVIAQGSYRNNTNVRQDSDVDIGVLCGTTFLNQYPEGKTQENFGFSTSDYRYEQFKNEVEEALADHFGRKAVVRGNKAFDVHETSYHVEADVAAFFVHRRYAHDGSHHEGVALLTDRERRRIENWPAQHYENGVAKNKQTGGRFKGVVRILKAIANEMSDSPFKVGDVPGFLVECLVWNVPDDRFGQVTYRSDVEGALECIFANTETDEKCKRWLEVSRLKWLFWPDQKWTREQAHTFALAAWRHIQKERK